MEKAAMLEGAGSLIASIADAVSGCGRGETWPALVGVAAQVVPFDQAAAVLFRAGAPPLRVFDTVATEKRDRLYRLLIEGAYLLSPYYNRVIAGRGPDGFYSIGEVAPDDFTRSEYYRVYYSEKRVVDEGLFYVSSLRDPDFSAVLILERLSTQTAFSVEERDRLKMLSPLVSALVSQFVDPRSVHPEQSGSRHDPLHQLGLTGRERDVAELILKGHSSKSAARLLDISPGTERVHRRRLYHKLKISSHAELFRMFIEQTGPDPRSETIAPQPFFPPQPQIRRFPTDPRSRQVP